MMHIILFVFPASRRAKKVQLIIWFVLILAALTIGVISQL